MAIFNSYVKLPEGNDGDSNGDIRGWHKMIVSTHNKEQRFKQQKNMDCIHQIGSTLKNS